MRKYIVYLIKLAPEEDGEKCKKTEISCIFSIRNLSY